MNGFFYHYLSFALTVLFSGALALSLTAFRKTENRSYRLLGMYFAVLLLAELLVRDMEVCGIMYTLLNRTFHVPTLPTALCYSIMSVMMAELARYCGGWNKRTLTVLCAVFFPLWFFSILMLENQSLFLKWLYILPYQLYTLGLSLGLLRQLRRADPPGDPNLQHLLLLTALFSVLILAEDSVAALFPSAKERQLSYRSVAENLLQVLYALHAMRFSARSLLRKENRLETPVPSPAAPDAIDGYARSVSLSAREQDVLALLLQGKNNREISAELGISQGTVKAHTHNIFQKSGAENRDGLAEAFRRHPYGGGTGKRESVETPLL